MNVKRNGRTSKLRLHRLNSPRRFRGPSCRDTAPGSRRSSAGGVSPPLLHTRRTSTPPRRPLLRIFHKVPRRAFCHTASSPPRASLPGRPRRRRCPPPEQARRSVRITRPPCVRACAFSSSHAPCAGGSRDSGRRIESLFPGLSCNGRALRPDFSRGMIRSGFARAQENPGRI